MNWGAFAGGLADGYTEAEKLRLAKEQNDREQQEFAQKKKDWARQDAMHAQLDAAGNTVDPASDPSQVMSSDDYATKFQPPAAPGGFSGWISRQFGSAKTPVASAAPADPAAPAAAASPVPNAASPSLDDPTANAPAAGGAFGAAQAAIAPTAAAPDTASPAIAAAGTVPKALTKDDYVPATGADGKVVYAPRTSVKKATGTDLYENLANAIAPFDPVQAMTIKKGVQEYQSGDYKLKAQAIEQSVLAAGRQYATDPQGALDAISNTHTLVPDGQQVKLTYDPKTNKVNSQFFTETAKGLIPQGPEKQVAFDDVMKQALSYGSADSYWKNLELTYNHTHQMATELNQKAMLANEGARLAIAQNADKRQAEHEAAQNDYLKARTNTLQAGIGDGWKVNATHDPDSGQVQFTRVPSKGAQAGAKPQVFDNEWGGWTSPEFAGNKDQITQAAAAKGLVAKLAKDGKVYYINPKTNMMSPNMNEAITGTAAPTGPQIPLPTD